MVRKFLTPLLGLFASVTIFALGAQLAFADPRDFTLVNGSPVTLTHVYVSPSDTSDWEEDVMGRDVLNPGESVDIVFPASDSNVGKCLYDIKVLARDGREGFLYKVDLCTTTTVTFS